MPRSRRVPEVRLPVLMVAAALLAACAGDAPSPGGESADDSGEAASPAVRAALLTSGPVSDAGWYAGAYEGLVMLGDSLGWDVRHQQTRTPSEFDEAFLSYGSQGYDLVFAHGNEYQDAAIRAGERFPDMTIVVSGGGRVSDNVVPLIFRLEEGAYLAGMLAGGMTSTGTVGMVGGVAIPPALGTFQAFGAGARAANADVTVLEAWIGSWDDVAAAKEAAVAQLRRGADVLIHNTDGASFAIFQAVREERDLGRDAWALGMNRNQNDVAPDVILGSAVIRIPEAFLLLARAWEAGDVGGAPFVTGMEVGIVDLVVNPALASRIPPEQLQRIAAARQAILDGTLDVPRVPFIEGEEGAAGS